MNVFFSFLSVKGRAALSEVSACDVSLVYERSDPEQWQHGKVA